MKSPLLTKPVVQGRLMDPGREGRIKMMIGALNERVESVEGLVGRINGLEARLATLEGKEGELYAVKHRGHGKWGVDDAEGKALKTGQLSREAAEWLCEKLLEAGPNIRLPDYDALLHLAERKAEAA